MLLFLCIIYLFCFLLFFVHKNRMPIEWSQGKNGGSFRIGTLSNGTERTSKMKSMPLALQQLSIGTLLAVGFNLLCGLSMLLAVAIALKRKGEGAQLERIAAVTGDALSGRAQRQHRWRAWGNSGTDGAEQSAGSH
ncbi:hypothetical protein OH710_07485 [Pseudomonas capsici]|nr:hypothetical protein [Pseudomonas capsici]MCV4272480.1 hypothetical protein [Pseudomonas capsici]